MNSSLRYIVPVATTVLISMCLTACNGKGGAAGLATKVKEAIGPDVRDYQALSYPTNAFGVGTAYVTPASGKQVTDADFICSTWKCLGVESADEPSDANDALHIRVRGKTYATVGKGGQIAMTTDDAKQYAFSVALPKIEQVLSLGAGLDSKSIVKADVQFGSASKRLLGKPDFIAYLNDGSDTSPTKAALQKAFAQGALVVVVGDVVIDSLKATITASSELAPKIDAKLGGVASAVFSDAEASFKVTKTSNSTYRVEAVGPLIALRLLKSQPGAGLLENAESWDRWIAVAGPETPHAKPVR